jgi:hypothetical protein
MKPITLLAGLSAAALSSPAQADVTVNITGATAFRASALLSIRSRFSDSGQPYKFAHDQVAGGTAYTGATRAIFIGTFPGIAGVTTIRCSFNGSVEGIAALATTTADPTYYQPALLASTAAAPAPNGAELALQGTTGVLPASSQIAFSDVTRSSTPFASASLLPANPRVGVIVFTMLTNEGSTVTNVTTQQFRALFSTGSQPLNLFTGNAADTSFVFATGRNDGSGTRTTYLAETGFGISTPANQYVTNVSTATALSTIQLVPAGGVNTPPLPGQLAANKSTIWGNDIPGNGGYNSGSTLRTDMGKTGAAVTVLDADGADVFGAPVRADLVTWLSINDAITARSNGAVFCGYNGVKLDVNGPPLPGTTTPTLTANDKFKVTNGAYTAWGYENMYLRAGTLAASDTQKVYDGIKAEIPTNLGTAGIALADMIVARPADGGLVQP